MASPSHAKPQAGPGHRRKSSQNSSDTTKLASEDIHALFVGAPYFLLDEGPFGLWQPQVIFPWCDHDLLIQNFWDRRPLSHSSFSSSTLHAHLPVPDGYVVKGETPAPLQGLQHAGRPKRPTFDISVYEVPNMLCSTAKEPGSLGFRHFLELPVADQVRYTGPEIPRARPGLRRVSMMTSAIEAFDAIEHHSHHPYAQCLDGTVHDRKAMLLDGPSAWKRIGVRESSMGNLIERLETLRDIRDDMLHAEVDKTILCMEPIEILHRDLYSKFLLPPPRSMTEEEDPHSLKSQIRMLTTALAAPGAWINFSLEEWRLYAGQILWEMPPHRDGDCLDPEECEDAQKRPWVNPGLERKWLLIQMLLAGELLIRLDAVSRAGVLRDPDENITAIDIHEFDKLRDGKVNWDLIVARRFLDSFGISHCESQTLTHSEEGLHGRRRSLRDAFIIHRRSSVKSASEADSAWECKLTPYHIEQQLHGLFVFAEYIGWPGVDALKDLPSKINEDLYSHPVCSAATSTLGRDEMYSRNPSRRQILLHNIDSQDSNDPKDNIGWITRSWLSGFVPPGESIRHLLLATVLENDPEALSTLGPVANLYGGFSYHGRSWWSKQCIVGRVLASLPGTKECMGWIRSDVLPVDRSTSQPLDGRWFEARTKELPPTNKKPRIQQGNRISHFSTPLGDGDISREAFSLPVDRPRGEPVSIDLDVLSFVSASESESEPEPSDAGVGMPTISFNVQSHSPDFQSTKESVSLRHNIHFVTSYNCRPPAGKASISNHEDHHEPSRLPGHPLHASYEYLVLPIRDLIGATSLHKVVPGGEILVIDARGSATQETFARAWCAATGSNAVIGRVGRTCLACCIREARAVDVSVVIRVGDGARNRAGSLYALNSRN